MIKQILVFLTFCWAMSLAQASHAASCNAAVSNINFGSVSVRSGAINQTSGSIQITCTALLGPIGVCIRFGDGSGGAGANQSPRYMRRSDNSILEYELRPNGNGSIHGTLTETYVLVPAVAGAGSVTIPFYADVISTNVSIGTGSYSSDFSGTANIELTYGLVACGLGGTTVSVPSFQVTAQVVASCEVDAGTLSFGDISTSVTAPIDAEATINVRCTDNTPYVVSLDMGMGSGVIDPESRKLTNGLSTLSYGIYSDPARVQVWGNTLGNTVDGTGAGLNQALTAYGRIHGGQTASVGLYQDSVLVTVTY